MPKKKTKTAPTITPLTEIEVPPPNPSVPQVPHVLLAAPSGDGTLSIGTATSLSQASLGKMNVEVMFPASSMLTRTFNMAWIQFLSKMGNPYTHFAMIHNDIGAEPGWLDKLMEDLTAQSLDLLSVLMPIKNDWGVTSTATSLQPSPFLPSTPRWPRRRLTMAEANRLPQVFTFADVKALWEKDGIEPLPSAYDCLLPNTGLWLCKAGPWCEAITFHSENYNFKLPDGSWCHDENTEDWALGRDIHELNENRTDPDPIRVAISRKVTAFHIGGGGAPNQGVWGKMSYDQPVCEGYRKEKEKAESPKKEVTPA